MGGFSAVLRASAAFSCLGLEPREQVDRLEAGRPGLRPVGDGCPFAEPGLVAGAIPACEGAEDRAAALADLLVDRLLEETPWTSRQREGCAVFAGAANGASAARSWRGCESSSAASRGGPTWCRAAPAA